MKVFRVVMSSVGTTFVEADRYEKDADYVLFFRGEFEFARYPTAMVKEITESPLSPGGGSLFTTESPEG